MTLLRLDAVNDEVWNRTLAAVASTLGTVKPMVIRCTHDGCPLAHVGNSSNGPLFTSSWEVQHPNPFRFNVDGQDLGRRAAIREQNRRWPASNESGAPSRYVDRHGVLALLALPPEFEQDYPDLLVRCEHGDAVLNRGNVIGWMRSNRAPRIDTAMPRRQYAPLRTDVGRVDE